MTSPSSTLSLSLYVEKKRITRPLFLPLNCPSVNSWDSLFSSSCFYTHGWSLHICREILPSLMLPFKIYCTLFPFLIIFGCLIYYKHQCIQKKKKYKNSSSSQKINKKAKKIYYCIRFFIFYIFTLNFVLFSINILLFHYRKEKNCFHSYNLMQ